MKHSYKLLTLLLFIFIFFFTTGCASKKENKIEIDIIYDGFTINKTISENESLFDYQLDESYLFIDFYYDEDLTQPVDFKNIKNDHIKIYAKTVEKGTTYKINYDLDGGEFNVGHPNKYNVGEITNIPSPKKDKYYTFAGWLLNDSLLEMNNSISVISDKTFGDINLKATWIDNANYYNINYVYDLNKVESPLENMLTKIVREGDEITLPFINTVSGSYFHGWYKDQEYKTRIKTMNEESINSDTTLYAKIENYKSPEYTYISFLGDSITTFKDFIPSSFARYYPIGDVEEVSDTWWYKLTQDLGYSLLMNNSYSGSCVSKGTMMGQSEERVKYLSDGVHNPDIVVIYMGTNDWASPVAKDVFKQSYKQMIDLIYKNFGNDLKIYICLMPCNTLSAGFNTYRNDLNDACIELANEYNLKTIDFRTAINSDNVERATQSGVHPNKYGMSLMAECAYKVISEDNYHD